MRFFQNIQFQQFVNLFILILIAHFNGSLQKSWLEIISISTFAILVEVAIEYFSKRRLYFPFSALITAFGILLMVGWSLWYIPFILIFLSLIQKRVIKIDGRHIFNPSNFAIIMALALFYPKALPIVEQLGERGYILTLVIAIGIVILVRVNRLLITLSFTVFYSILEYLIIGYSDPHFKLEEFVTKFYSISFVVYLFFMLTDPVTTPNETIKQVVFGSLVALVISILDYFYGLHIINIFVGLFIVSILYAPFYRDIESKKLFIIGAFLVLLLSAYILYLPPKFFSM